MAQALLAGVVVAWATNVVEGLMTTQQWDRRSLGDWLFSFALYAWFGLASGLVWGAALTLVDGLRPRKRSLFPVLLVPGLIFVSAFMVGGYWLNQSRDLPPFWTLQGKVWTLGLGMGILLVCLLLVFALSRTRLGKGDVLRLGAAPLFFSVGFLALLLPPIYLFATERGPSVGSRVENVDGPPVIVILVDTLRRDHLQCYGYGKTTSPHL
jgi:hypothetical protein